MVFAIEFTDDVDPTALATVFLGLVTVVSLFFTRRSLLQTREEIDLSRREVQEAHRPVVTPLVDPARMFTPYGSEPIPIGPQLVRQGVLYVPLENVGMGPALSVTAQLTLLTDDGQVSGANEGGDQPGLAAGIGAGAMTPLEMRVPGTL